ncbi:MAG: hypothetical protein LBF38_10280 [Deltaproteobacteria bacterium]|jgi:hypothetical protein|nr:hypothetical protein [Deltaproteobacteria bacterium]
MPKRLTRLSLTLFLALVPFFFLAGPILAQDDGPQSENFLDPAAASAAALESPASEAEAEAYHEPTPEELSGAALTPEVMITQPPLTEADFDAFVAMYNYVIFGSGSLNFNVFSRSVGVPLRRLNYLAAKISLPLGESERRAQIINELGLGVLMNGPEWEIFLRRQTQLEEITATMKRALAR